MPTRDEWHAILERRLPAPPNYFARSRAITALYARWYLQEPWLFKWSGMAAFASAQVSNGLALMEMLDAPHGALHASTPAQNPIELLVELYGGVLNLVLTIPLALHDAATRPLLRNDLDLIRQANDAIFRDVGWLHLAYASGGLKAIEPNLRSDGDAPLRDAFRMLDEGVQQLSSATDCQAGIELIQQGSIAMLRHEQTNILPSYLERMSGPGKLLASIGALMDLEGAPGFINQPVFVNYFGPLAVASGTRSVANTSDRWQWIERDVIPKWTRIDARFNERCPMHRQLVMLANETPSALQQTASLMNLAYRVLGLNIVLSAQDRQETQLPAQAVSAATSR